MADMAVTKGPAGYFVWVKDMKGGATPEKYHPWRLSANSEMKAYFESVTLGSPIPLGDNEWDMSLSTLATRYPCPEIKKDQP